MLFGFDILSIEGRDLRLNGRVDRKAELRRVLIRRSANSSDCYADHIERDGSRVFHLTCQRDLEGTVAKLNHGYYTSDLDDSTWFKIKNKNYSQSEDRAEFFDRGRKPVQSLHQGLDSCSLVCEEAAVGDRRIAEFTLFTTGIERLGMGRLALRS